MTVYELTELQEAMKSIEELKKAVEYFSPETNGCYRGFGRGEFPISTKAKSILNCEKFPFNLRLFKKSKTTAECELNIKGYFGGGYIEVDKAFVNHCKSYFENELEKAEKAFAEIEVKGGVGNGKVY